MFHSWTRSGADLVSPCRPRSERVSYLEIGCKGRAQIEAGKSLAVGNGLSLWCWKRILFARPKCRAQIQRETEETCGYQFVTSSVHSLQVTRELDEIRESAKGYREIMDDHPVGINGKFSKAARPYKTEVLACEIRRAAKCSRRS